MEPIDEKRKTIQSECLVGEPAFCTAECPFRLDVPDFIEKTSRGAFSAAYRALRNAVVFPGIVSRVCDAPCAKACPRASCDAPVDLPMLERAAVTLTPNRRPNSYNVPAKPYSIAIIGGGPSGLACALRLASSRYKVTVYEKSGRTGGHLWEKLAPEFFVPEIETAFAPEKYELLLGTEVGSLDEVNADAVYVATGTGGTSFGIEVLGMEVHDMEVHGPRLESRRGVFLGGSLRGSGSAQAIADGLRAVTLIESYLKTGTMAFASERVGTRLQIAPGRLRPTPKIEAANGGSYTEEEAQMEAGRCLKCSCDACRRRCELLEVYKKIPNRLADEVYFTIHPASLFAGETFAKRLMASCTQCGACRDACPAGLDTGDLLLAGRRALHQKGKFPWVFHRFWLDDMEHAMGPSSALCRSPLGVQKSGVAYFPGCQLGSSDPRYVMESYRWILSEERDAALWLSCCGVPAVWSGDEERFAEVAQRLRKDWESLGCPKLIFACPTCANTFRQYFPEIEGRHLIEYMAERNFSPRRHVSGERFAVFDPCSGQRRESLGIAARKLAERSGALLEPSAGEGGDFRCCSYGGHISIANPSFANRIVKSRVELTDAPYIAYCSNCRDIFADAGKPCVHLLDILFDLGGVEREAPDNTQRRDNRAKLRHGALLEFWKEETHVPPDGREKFIIDADVRKKMSADRILAEDVIAVAEFCERTGRTVADREKGSKTGYSRVGHFTIWVTYVPEGDRIRVLNVYGHRMNIKLEETWNGQKVYNEVNSEVYNEVNDGVNSEVNDGVGNGVNDDLQPL